MRAISLAFVIVVVTACGAAPSRSQRAEPSAHGHGAQPSAQLGSTSDGASSEGLLLRVAAPAGTVYRTRATARTDLEGATVLTQSEGHFEILSRDAAGVVEIASRVDAIELTDIDGAPVAAPGRVDLTGVVMRRRMDARAGPVGAVVVEGTNAENASFARTMAASVQSGVSRLPEHRVRVGERWREDFSMSLPIESLSMPFECRGDYWLTGLGRDDRGDAIARIRFELFCHGYLEVDSNGVGLPLTIDVITTGENRVARADGISGTTITSVETTTVLDTHCEIQETVVRQHVETATWRD